MTDTGGVAVNINLGRARRAYVEAGADALGIAAEHVLQVSNTRVPVEEGTLERSGTTSVDKSKLVAAVSYDTPYAVAQHERMDYAHKGKGQAKYLESALTGERRVVAKLLADEIRRRNR
ncbi:hypothetical protein D9V41_09225 [Aeromicrobium phragmitis]|uniref:HK97 gp10 family phage protein n=1 Tax=Aeromicrobium phragmitis TaxID=2478914 RepID=A0A3L8PMR6_9ACTN|nr:minor capsid protein [Aeromicrobium phragmitis]RLV56059.1 hypothetical protein D9V41_09225 [Aeromicrobium phragmitis]